MEDNTFIMMENWYYKPYLISNYECLHVSDLSDDKIVSFTSGKALFALASSELL
jgi:hypothetical protein